MNICSLIVYKVKWRSYNGLNMKNLKGGFKLKKLLMVLMSLMVAAVSLVGCGGEQAAAPAPTGKVLKVGTEATYAPFEFTREGSKEIVGYDVDLMNAIGAKLNRKIEFVSMDFDQLTGALNSGKIDVIAANMSITEARKVAVDFTNPYKDGGLIIVVPNTVKDKVTIDSLKGKKIAVQRGTISEEYAKKINGAKIVSYGTNGEASLAILRQQADAFINDEAVVRYYIANQGGAEIVKTTGDIIEKSQSALAVKKGNALKNDINKAMDELKKDGTMAKINVKWFGETQKK